MRIVLAKKGKERNKEGGKWGEKDDRYGRESRHRTNS